MKYGHCSQPNSHDYELSIGGFGANGTSTSVPLWGVGNSSLDAYCYEVGIVLTRAVGETINGTVFEALQATTTVVTNLPTAPTDLVATTMTCANGNKRTFYKIDFIV